MKLWQRRTLGILAVAGGGAGFILALTLMFNQRHWVGWLVCALFAVLYAWGIWSGVRILEGNKAAERPLSIFWMLQVPIVGTPALTYWFSCGFDASVLLQLNPVKFAANWSLGAKFNLTIAQSDEQYRFGVNVFALVIAIWLRQISRKS